MLTDENEDNSIGKDSIWYIVIIILLVALSS